MKHSWLDCLASVPTCARPEARWDVRRGCKGRRRRARELGMRRCTARRWPFLRATRCWRSRLSTWRGRRGACLQTALSGCGAFAPACASVAWQAFQLHGLAAGACHSWLRQQCALALTLRARAGGVRNRQGRRRRGPGGWPDCGHKERGDGGQGRLCQPVRLGCLIALRGGLAFPFCCVLSAQRYSVLSTLSYGNVSIRDWCSFVA